MSTKRLREIDSTEMKTKRKRLSSRAKCRKIISPEIGSLYDILHDHATTSLYVPPLCWTDLHTQVLGCRFVPQPPQNTPTPSLTPSPPRTSSGLISHGIVSETVVFISRSLDVILDPIIPRFMRSKNIKNLLDKLFPGQLSELSPTLTMRCGSDNYVDGVRCQAMWRKPVALQSFDSTTTRSSGSLGGSSVAKSTVPKLDKPVLAFLDRRHLDCIRRSCFRIPSYPDGSLNIPVHRLQELRSRKLIPKNVDEDHFILATMIAMAQEHAYENVFFGTDFAPTDIQVRVLTVSDEDQSFIVYTGVIPAAFLSMFHEPSRAPPGDAKITIQYQRVPIWPVLGLKERLGQALGQDLVGKIDTDHIETYSDESSSGSQSDGSVFEREAAAAPSQLRQGNDSIPTMPQVTPSPKRKREILSEVLNVSFSEDHESPGYPSELLAKRRCLEEGNNDKTAASSLPRGTS
ncbi:hypothetical protein F5Y13DRAFT_150405 [Hypoxylon sp. FL1857]|nr:hypothetical protein F5Y13DRAFT_150405 [Hypoxylon sp. FL1857]